MTTPYTPQNVLDSIENGQRTQARRQALEGRVDVAEFIEQLNLLDYDDSRQVYLIKKVYGDCLPN